MASEAEAAVKVTGVAALSELHFQIGTEASPRHHIYLLPAGSTQKGVLNGAFFRFQPDFVRWLSIS
jgi:hypothetical protein